MVRKLINYNKLIIISVVEFFFLNDDKQYLEVEIGP